MPTERITIYDVAAHAGVAISTVSRVLNGSSEVSDRTRERVQQTIEALRFQPDRTARALASQRTTTLAVSLLSATSLFYVELLKGVKDVLRERDMDLLLSNLGSQVPIATLQRFLGRGAVDGLLVASLPIDDELAQQLLAMRAPVVLVGRRHDAFDSWYWDERASARMAVEHLIGLGHRRIGMIAAHPWSLNAADRIAGYHEALAVAGIDPDPALVVRGATTKHAGYSEEAGSEGLDALMMREDPPTAVFASSDVQAFGAWAAATKRGLRIPEDLSLVGHDGLKLSRFLGLTTVEQGMQGVGHRATERLIARMEGHDTARTEVEVETELVVRTSTAPPR